MGKWSQHETGDRIEGRIDGRWSQHEIGDRIEVKVDG